MDEAPSLRISIRFTTDCGMTFRSTGPTVPRVPAGPTRRPFSRTRCRLEPRPRRFRVLTPGPPVVTKPVSWLFTWNEPEASEERCSTSAVSTRPWRVWVSPVITWIGELEV